MEVPVADEKMIFCLLNFSPHVSPIGSEFIMLFDALLDQ